MPDHKYWPEASQRDLLRATFVAGATGAAAFQAWKTQIDMADHPDIGSFRLLPTLWRRLLADGIDDPVLSKLKGIARRNWFQNQRFFRSWAPLLGSLHEAGIPCLLLSGPSLALTLRDYALLTESVLGLLVRPRQARQAVEHLQAAGWRPKKQLPVPLTESYVARTRMLGLRNEESCEVRFHWRLSTPLCGAGSDCWDHAVQVSAHGIPLAVLSPADQILYCCTEDSLTPDRPMFLRAVDVMLLIHGEARIDWERIVEQARAPSVAVPLLEVMCYLQSVLDARIPPPVWEQLVSLPTT